MWGDPAILVGNNMGGGVENLTKQRSGSGFSSRKRRASAITIANGPENENDIKYVSYKNRREDLLRGEKRVPDYVL